MTLPAYLNLDTKPWEAYVDGRWPVITLDFETTNAEKGDPREDSNRIVLACAKLNDGPLMSEDESWEFLRELSGKPCVLVAHNAKFELGWLNRLDIDTTHWLPWDTMVAEYVIAGNRRWDLDLDSVAQRYGLGAKGRLVDYLMKNGVCPSEMPEHWLLERVKWDVDRTYKLYQRQVQIIGQLGLDRVLFTRCIFTPVLARMEAEGLRLSSERVVVEYERLLARRAELLTALNVIAKGKKLKGPQYAEVLYDQLGFPELTDRRGEPVRTSKGKRKTDQKTLDVLLASASTDAQREFVALRREYGKVDAALTKNVEFFQKVCEERGGTFVANFNQCRVATHRLSSSGKRTVFKDGKARAAQFQNLPRVYKSLFEAPEGWVYAEADGTQLEWRIGGSLSRDPQVLEDVRTGHDVHKFTASVLLRKAISEVLKGERQDAKPNTFKPMYGGQRGTKREEAYFVAFRERYKAMSEMQEGWAHTVLRDKQLRIPTGLIFYWPDTEMTRSGYITNTPNIYDYPIQSIATADIIPVSTVYTYWECRAKGLNVKLANTIHDSVLAMVLEKELDKYWEVVVHCFLDRAYEYMDKVYGLDLYVPLGVSYRAGKYWGDGEETTVSYPMGGKTSG